MGWWYVFGSASMTLLLHPDPHRHRPGAGLRAGRRQGVREPAYLNYEQPLGWFLRALHYYAGSGMVVMVLVHMTQVFLHGAYKYPRELTWVVGVFLLLCTLGMFFTGQVCAGTRTPTGAWPSAARWPGACRCSGRGSVELLLGGPMIGGDALSRFFALHVFVIPGLLAALPGRSPLAGAASAASAPARPRADRSIPKTYDAEYDKELKTRRPLPGRGDAQGRVLLGTGGDRRRGPRRAARAQGPDRPARPDAGRRQSAARMAVPLAVRPAVAQPARRRDVHHPGLPGAPDRSALFLVPFVSNRGERAPSRRPVAVLAVIVIYTVLGVLTYQGATSPWSPEMTAWSGDPVPEAS